MSYYLTCLDCDEPLTRDRPEPAVPLCDDCRNGREEWKTERRRRRAEAASERAAAVVRA